jgi:hypothetical protein
MLRAHATLVGIHMLGLNLLQQSNSTAKGVSRLCEEIGYTKKESMLNPLQYYHLISNIWVPVKVLFVVRVTCVHFTIYEPIITLS